MKFAVIQGEGGLPYRNDMAFVNFRKSHSKNIFFFACTNENDNTFERDEQGRFYQEGECVASCFEKIIEQFALYEEIQQMGELDPIHEFYNFKSNLTELFELKLLEAPSDIYSQWYCKPGIYLKQTEGCQELFLPKGSDLINSISKE